MANIILEVLQNRIILLLLFTWFLCQLLKFTLQAVTKKHYDFGFFYRFRGGGMPSSHAAVVSAFATMVYLEQGTSLLFITALLIAVVTIYDALAFRRQLGAHAKILNMLHKQRGKAAAKQLEERIGHEPEEVVVGLVVGIVIALLLY